MGTVNDYREAERLYINFLLGHAPDLSGMRIALDCANGATFKIAPRVFQRAGADVFAMYNTPDGKNINLDCGSTHPDHLQQVVRDGNFDLGIALDGDGDRVILVDGTGELVQGDHMLYITALHRKEHTVVATIMSNMGLEVKLREHGIALERTAVGDRYVHERLLERGLTLGGEQSGHILILDAAPTGDGILAALQTVKAVRASGKSLETWRNELVMFPQTLVNVRVSADGPTNKHSISKHAEVIEAVTHAEKALEGRGRVNLRPSGTEPLVRVMIEGPNEEEIHTLAESIASVIRRVSGT
jgi:phosphoglucosamine mutase